jgi:hypothetical protein
MNLKRIAKNGKGIPKLQYPKKHCLKHQTNSNYVIKTPFVPSQKDKRG